MNSWVIITDERRAGGMLDAARKAGGKVTAAVAGTAGLADFAAGLGFDRVLHFAIEKDTPVEAYAGQIAEVAGKEELKLVLSSDAPVSRVLLGAVAAKLNAALISSVRTLSTDGESIIVSKSAAEGKVLEDVKVNNALAAIFDGDDVETAGGETVPVEQATLSKPETDCRLLETVESGGDGAGILTAQRVVGIGMGVRTKDDLQIIDELAGAMHAEIACTLPVCDDMRWFSADRVVGSSHNQISPDLYIAVGISGQPQHVSGVRDAKVVVAVNDDPENRMFKNCDYGILGDLYKIVPELTAAFKNI